MAERCDPEFLEIVRRVAASMSFAANASV